MSNKTPKPLPPDLAKLTPALGATLTGPDGHIWYGNGTSWQADPLPVDPGLTGEELLGFVPTYETPYAPVHDQSGNISGNVPLDPEHFATQETADQMAELFGATVVVANTRPDGVEERELVFPGGTDKQNAGLVADSIMKHPTTAIRSLGASIGYPTVIPVGGVYPSWWVGEVKYGMRDVAIADREKAMAEMNAVLAKYSKA